MSFFKSVISEVISEKLGVGKDEVFGMINRPSKGRGDFAFPCFRYAKSRGKDVSDVGESLKDLSIDFVDKIEVVGGFVNFFVNSSLYIEKILSSDSSDVLKGGFKKGVIGLEYPSPNTNKPLHLGHIRNIVVGNCLFNLLSFAGFDVRRINLNNDRGISMCNAMLGYKLFKDKLDLKGNKGKIVGDAYVLFVKESKKNPKLVEDSKELLRKWEAGDKETIELWKEVNSFSLDSHKEIYSFFNLSHDEVFNESELYEDGKGIVLSFLDKGVLKKDEDGFVFADLDSKGLDKKVLLRGDGTSVYATQDVALASKVSKSLGLDEYVYITASEQNFYFKQLFEILKLLEISLGVRHVSYGLVNLPEGRMKSREGNVVDADDLIDSVSSLAKKELKLRHKSLEEEELVERAGKICLGSINFAFANHDLGRNFIFNPEESIRFDGETGAYVQYTYARLFSAMEGKLNCDGFDVSLIDNEEVLDVVKVVEDFGENVVSSVENLKPSVVAQSVLRLCQLLNVFYERYKINVDDVKLKNSRRVVVSKSLFFLEKGMGFLGVPVMSSM